MGFARVHIVGSSPRSGTTLMFELITSCFYIKKFGNHEVSLFEKPKKPTATYISKQPMDFVHVSRVIRWKPLLYCIYMERDPRDIVVSQHGTSPGYYWCDFNIWRKNRNLLETFGQHPRLFVCKYEELVANPNQIQDQLENHFHFLRRRYFFSEFAKVANVSQDASNALKGIRPISTKSVGLWRENLPRLAAQLSEHPDMPRRLIEAGYETDFDWTRMCNGVTPDTRQSVRSAHDRLRGLSWERWVLARALRRARTVVAELRYLASRTA